VDLVEAIEALNPPAKSGNDACRRVGGHRAAVLAAYRSWRQGAGAAGGTAGTGEALHEDEPLATRVDDAARRERARVQAWWELDRW
jgi:hypothetical protein